MLRIRNVGIKQNSGKVQRKGVTTTQLQ